MIQHAPSTTFPVAAQSAVPELALDKLSQPLDFETPGVPKHLGLIAEYLGEWDGRIADEMGLTTADVANIDKKCSGGGTKVQWYRAEVLAVNLCSLTSYIFLGEKCCYCGS